MSQPKPIDAEFIAAMDAKYMENDYRRDSDGGFVGFVSSSSTSFSWPDPEPLPEGLLPVDAFASEFMPDRLAPWVDDIANRLQCPPDYVGVSAMVALGGLLGRRIGVRPQQKTDWMELPNVWGAFIGRPGMLQSPAMGEALKPIHHLEAEAAKSTR
jgi:Protein of unknown function (DUF3987)